MKLLRILILFISVTALTVVTFSHGAVAIQPPTRFTGFVLINNQPAPLSFTVRLTSKALENPIESPVYSLAGSTYYSITLPTGMTSHASVNFTLLTAGLSIDIPTDYEHDSIQPGNTIYRPITVALDITGLGITTVRLPYVTGSPYAATIQARGGFPPYSFSANGLPVGMSLSSSGTVSGVPSVSGNYHIAITVTDQMGNTATTFLSIATYWQVGDANGDKQIDIADVIAVERVILGLSLSTPGTDANQDRLVSLGDVTTIERFILGLY